MLNQIVTVGRLQENPEVQNNEGKKRSVITVAVPRSYKNENGEYESDFIDCIIFGAVAENTAEYCKKGDLLGIKGRIQTREENGIKIMEFIGEKVTFLSSKSE